jgi:hypothetical protein
MYVILDTNEGASHPILTVGFFDPAGKWNPHSDHATIAAASIEAHYLNGGQSPYLPKLLDALENAWHTLRGVELTTNNRAAARALRNQMYEIEQLLAGAGRSLPDTARVR